MTSTIRLFLLLEAVTFIAAALIHFGVISLGYGHQKAGIAETVIATVLMTGATLTWLGQGWTRIAGLTAQAFALLATLVGIFTIIVGVGPRTVPDIMYHIAIVAVLIWGLVVAARAQADHA